MTVVFRRSQPLRAGLPMAIAAVMLAAQSAVSQLSAADEGTADGGTAASAESRLKDVEQALKVERRRDEKLAEEAAAFARQNEVLRRELITAARRAQDIEAELFTLEQELEVLTAQQAAEFGALTDRHEQLAGLLGALERIARFPPEAFVAQRTDPALMVRSAILLRSAVPKIDARASALREELAILTSLSDEIEEERRNLRRTAQDLRLERARLEELLTRKASREERTRSERRRAELRAQALAREAEDLRDLVHRLEADRQEREAAERKAREQALAEAERRARQAAEAEADLLARAAVVEADRQMQDILAAVDIDAGRGVAEVATTATTATPDGLAEDQVASSVPRAKVTLELTPDDASPEAPGAADGPGDTAEEASGPVVVALATDTAEADPRNQAETPLVRPAEAEATETVEAPQDLAPAEGESTETETPAENTEEPQREATADAASAESQTEPEADGASDEVQSASVAPGAPEAPETPEAPVAAVAPAADETDADDLDVEQTLASLSDTVGDADVAGETVAAADLDVASGSESGAQLAFAVPQKPAVPPQKAEPITNARGRLAMPSQGQIVERYGQRTKAGQTSKGLRIQTRPDALVVATYDGRVAFAGPFRGYGLILIIEHGEGYHTLLAGLSEIYGTVGQKLLAGEPIGKMDPAGSANPVLYVELRRQGQPINPLPWLASRSNKVHG